MVENVNWSYRNLRTLLPSQPSIHRSFDLGKNALSKRRFEIHSVHHLRQGLDTNGISWNTVMRCNNNDGSFIFNRTHLHYSIMSELEPGLESDHVVYKINISQIFWLIWLLMKICLKGIISITIFERLHEWWQSVTTWVHQTGKKPTIVICEILNNF